MKKPTKIGLGTMHGVILALLVAGCAKSPPPKSPTPSSSSDSATSDAGPRESSASLQAGGCQSADLCSPAVCSQRQSKVHPTCDVPRSCTGNVTSEVAQKRLTINQNCLAAREAVAACYSEQDSGHQQQIESVERAIELCESKL